MKFNPANKQHAALAHGIYYYRIQRQEMRELLFSMGINKGISTCLSMVQALKDTGAPRIDNLALLYSFINNSMAGRADRVSLDIQTSEAHNG